ncbi:maleylpyruvate isomerase family mycothiol-dependent enzyme [Amycolatopsis sp. YIM 10]|uniref:maleylpyruvate isomerase family mycothiol-dependent enzyme n=1 Tax=Amycolatopsis sp. YIM 10 TaxID=2653857 RepID=UPI0012A9046D|nr:maleylpyruvate isomerase family mycothiol-dependent enzyme [Amycolatopsis sp. YIM 10]QFU87918.1 mycothiol-dependent maleylpyruvate isomerase [Amycolatopsis sp. YIM 10]
MAVSELRANITAGHERLAKRLAELTDDEARGPSALPGWTRGHVLTHLENLGRAFRRQAEYALAGKTIEVYDGGRAGRDAGIEAGAGRAAAELREGVLGSIQGLEEIWDRVPEDGWQRPVRYRESSLLDTVFCWWRELEIHFADADLGYRPDDWSPEFCAHALEFLAPRAPEGVRLVLKPADDPREWAWGSGPEVEARGRLTELTAWMAGRRVDKSLPELAPWP